MQINAACSVANFNRLTVFGYPNSLIQTGSAR